MYVSPEDDEAGRSSKYCNKDKDETPSRHGWHWTPSSDDGVITLLEK
jgi:hypothetical protein